jgi:hypothetical protein
LLSLLIFSAHATLPENGKNFPITDWVALIPKDDLDALLNLPDFLNDIADGSDKDTVNLLQKNTKLDAQGKRFQEVHVFTTVVTE